MSTTRRQFLNRTIATTAGISGVTQLPGFLQNTALYAAEKSRENVLVVIQLSGGNDGLNTLIPYQEKKYYELRPTIAIGKEQVIKLENGLGLHPNLKSFAKLFEQDQMAIVNGIGYPNPDRSHFSSMDIWHTGNREVTYRTKGWIGKVLDQKNKGSSAINGLHLGREQRPRALEGVGAPAPSIRSLDRFKLDIGGRELVRSAIDKHLSNERPNSNPLLNFVHESMTSAITASDQIQAATKQKKTTTKYPNHDLAKKLQSVSQLIDANLNCRVYYLTLDGFDNHSQQQSVHPNLMLKLSESLLAFQKDLKERNQSGRVMTLVFSEFGRRLKENASTGTDHGAAAPLFLIGDNVKPGIIGKYPSLHKLTDGDLKYHTDFRSVYGTIIDDWFQLDHKKILAESYPKLELFQS